MIAGTRFGTGGAGSNRAASLIRHAPPRKSEHAGPPCTWRSTAAGRRSTSSMTALTRIWAPSHLTGGLSFGQRADQRRAGAVHPALHGSHLDPQDGRGLLVVEPEDLDHHERFPERHGELPDGLLEPEPFVRVAGSTCRSLPVGLTQGIIDRYRAFATGLSIRVDGAVPRDPEQPAGELPLTSVGTDGPIRFDEGLLGDVVGRCPVPGEVKREAPQVRLVVAHQSLEGEQVAGLSPADGLGLRLSHSPPPRLVLPRSLVRRAASIAEQTSGERDR